MNNVSLDSVGIAGFSHDFGALQGKRSAVADLFDNLGTLKPSPLTPFILMIAPVLPFLMKLPTKRGKLIKGLNVSMGAISDELLERTRREGVAEDKYEEKSIIGLLSKKWCLTFLMVNLTILFVVKSESEGEELHMSQEEIMAQVNSLLLFLSNVV